MKTENRNNSGNILVLGGTGKTGRRVIEKLIQKGIRPRIGSRSGSPKFDWEDQSTWPAELETMKAVYITFQPDLAVPGADKTIRKFARQAVESGVEKLILLSGRGESEAEHCEQIIMDSGVDWTILRASWFFQNFSESDFLEPILAGYVELPVGEVGEPFIDANDIADVAVAALTETGHSGKLYELTGPRLLTFRQAVQEISEAIGRPIQYNQLTVDQYAAMLKEYQVPDESVELVTYLFSEVLDGRNESITNGVQQALGRQPTDFSVYVRKTAASGVWNKSVSV